MVCGVGLARVVACDVPPVLEAKARVIGVGPKTLLPAASCTWTVTSQVEPGTACVVGVLVQVFPVMASFAAGPALVTESDAEPGVSPATDAVTVQLPGAPVVVTVEL